MNTRSLLIPAMLCAMALGGAPSLADAQLGGALRAAGRARTAIQEAAAPAAAPASVAPAPARRSADVLEITPENLDRLERALAAEATARAEAATALAALPSLEQYRACETRLYTSPRMAALGERYAEEIAGKENDAAALQALLIRHGERVSALMAEECGRPPGEQREQRAALQRRIEDSGARAGGFRLEAASPTTSADAGPSREYAILKERVVPFCRTPDRLGNYVYTTAEQEALRPRCGSLLPAVETTL
jgi:hypothetical protein